MRKFLPFTTAFLFLTLHSGACLDFRVFGDAIITEANNARDPIPSFDSSPPLKGPQPLNSGENGDETTTGGAGPAVGNWPETETSYTELPLPSEFGEHLNWTASYPWLASIHRGRKQICTGTLIDREYILTTAFCLFDLSPADLDEVEVDIGFKASSSIAKYRQFELNKGPYATLKVKRSLRHLRFSPTTAVTIYNDIALLQLVTPIIPTEGVEPIRLETETGMESDAELQDLIGWRDGVDLNGDSVQYWRHQPSQGVSLEQCRRGYLDILDAQGVSPGMMCSGGTTDGTSCRWKFGTPLVVNASLRNSTSASSGRAGQVGLYSWGSEALLPKCRFSPETPTPMVFTRVSAYYEWIQRNMNLTWASS